MKLLSFFTFLFPYEGTDTTMVNATMSLSFFSRCCSRDYARWFKREVMMQLFATKKLTVVSDDAILVQSFTSICFIPYINAFKSTRQLACGLLLLHPLSSEASRLPKLLPNYLVINNSELKLPAEHAICLQVCSSFRYVYYEQYLTSFSPTRSWH